MASARPPLADGQGLALPPTMNAWLGGDAAVVWPAAAFSVGCLALNVGLLRYLGRIERAPHHGGP